MINTFYKSNSKLDNNYSNTENKNSFISRDHSDFDSKYHISNSDVDSCISLRPLCPEKSSSDIYTVTSTSRFIAPELTDIRIAGQVKNKDISSPSKLNKLGSKSINLYQDMIGKRQNEPTRRDENNKGKDDLNIKVNIVFDS